MHLIRRAAFRATSSPSTSILSKPRSITTSSSFLLRSKTQSAISVSVFKRFASDEANSEQQENSNVESANSEGHNVREAIESATESASTYISEAAQSASNGVADAATDAAAAAGIPYKPREDRRESRPSYGNRDGGRDGERRPYDNNRGGDRGGYAPRGGERGGFGGRGGDRGGYQERRPTGSFDRSDQAERIMTPTSTVYIGNLLFDVTASDLTREFESYGTVKSTTVATDARGLSKGFGYVEFESIDQATAAIEGKHQTVLEGRRIIVNYMNKTVREPIQNPPSKTLFIGNLAFEMSDADLNKLFRDIRNVIDVRVAIDRRTGQPRGFAHADFVDTESAMKGKDALVGKEVYGRKLRIDFSGGSRESRGDGGSSPSGGYQPRERRDPREERERY